MDVNSLSHSKWNCKYHIVFAPKFRRKVAYGALRQDIANILSMLCKRKGVNIVEAEICPDHVHMLVEIPPNISVASFVGYIKGKSTLMIFERHANLKYKYGNRHFWCRGYYVDTVGKNAKKIFLRDRFNHASPNSAQTESVCAGALRVRLAGDAWYFGKLVKKKYIGDDLRPVEPEDIRRSHTLLYMTAVLALVVFEVVKVLVCLWYFTVQV
mgnify:CR=1 FL=1